MVSGSVGELGGSDGKRRPSVTARRGPTFADRALVNCGRLAHASAHAPACALPPDPPAILHRAKLPDAGAGSLRGVEAMTQNVSLGAQDSALAFGGDER